MKNPRHFEIQVENGHHPLAYECTTMHEAYGCMEDLRCICGRFADHINLDTVMVDLVDMMNGKISHSEVPGYYRINIREGEV